jgi:hypothetical protein
MENRRKEDMEQGEFRGKVLQELKHVAQEIGEFKKALFGGEGIDDRLRKNEKKVAWCYGWIGGIGGLIIILFVAAIKLMLEWGAVINMLMKWGGSK